MAYAVNITPRAERDLADLYDKINAEESEVALSWYRGLTELHSQSGRESEPVPRDRVERKSQASAHGNKPRIYRVIYGVIEEERRVQILQIRHGARRRFNRV